jgi:NSS family neurotransmitter:Na+ symporter
MSERRGVWGSKLGFILAASGSAIGLGNIVFFGANAYKYGGGAFYVPYLIALLILGLPMMWVELGLGHARRTAFPGAMRPAGKTAELFAWWSLINAIVIAMYYIVILAWAALMMIEAFRGLYETGVVKSFGALHTSWWPMVVAVLIWGANVFFLARGTDSIEKVVKIFVPLMWLFMIGLVIRGLTLPGGGQGVLYLFTPNFEGIASPDVWQGAFSQMFFSLSLGLGTMVAYASYLPKKTDLVASGGAVSFLNCSFEFIAGLAIFSMLFAFALVPTSSTLGMSFVVIPSGIGEFPFGQVVFAAGFFLLLLMAGLTSSISIIESPVSAMIDKFGWSRIKALAVIGGAGAAGSILFTLPMVAEFTGEEPVGLTFIDLIDHWAFSYSLLVTGLVEAIFIGHVYGIKKLRLHINETSRFKLGVWFDVLVKWIIPLVITAVLLSNIAGELGLLEGKEFYGKKLGTVSWVTFGLWLVATAACAVLLARSPWRDEPGSADGGES